jgi:hypothetical protein
LQDATGVRWDSTELLGWLNSGQREMLIYKPNANVKALAVKLAAGTRQSLPDDAVQLIDVTRNMGTDGNTPGRAIRQTQREALDATRPTWHSDTASAVVKHFIFNPLDPKAFYNYPPQPATGQGYVETVYGAVPVDATANSTISVDDIYETILLDYMLYRAFSKDSEYADQNKADKHFNVFVTALTGTSRVESGANPNTRAPAATRQPVAPSA